MRAQAAVLVALIGVASCSRTPEPSQASSSSSAAFTPVAPSARADASVAAVADAGTGASTDAGEPAFRADLDAFCVGAYTADADLLKQKCSDADYQSTIGFERAAGKSCTKDVTTLLGFDRTKFDATVGNACIAAVKTAAAAPGAGAADTFFTIPPCDHVITGSSKEGSACRWPPECADGLTCVGYAVGVDGVCRKPAKPGAACTTQAFGGVFNEHAMSVHHASCVKGSYCDGKTCVARAADGAACVSTKTCGDGRFCVLGACAKAQAATGEACAKGDDCAKGLYCDGSKCQTKKSAGASCTQDQCKGWCEIPKKPPGLKEGTCTSTCGSG